MRGYIYAADMYCKECGDAICRELPTPADPFDESSFDSDEYPKVIADHDGSSDCPQNCGNCHRPMDNELTPEGVQYVIDAILESIEDGQEARNAVHDSDGPDYYKGSRACEVVRDWAFDLLNYSLSRRDEFIVRHYLELTA